MNDGNVVTGFLVAFLFCVIVGCVMYISTQQRNEYKENCIEIIKKLDLKCED